MVWLDGLDIQIVKLLSASFAEQAPAEIQAVTRPEGDSAARFGNNLLPVDWKPEVKTSPVFNYPYARTREALETLRRNGEPDPYHGHKMRYVNPASGDYAMPTIGTFIQLLPSGFATGALPLDRRHGLCRGRGRRARAGSATRSSAGSRATSLSCRAGCRSAIMPKRKACCSAIPTGRCRKSSASGASSAATLE